MIYEGEGPAQMVSPGFLVCWQVDVVTVEVSAVKGEKPMETLSDRKVLIMAKNYLLNWSRASYEYRTDGSSKLIEH